MPNWGLLLLLSALTVVGFLDGIPFTGIAMVLVDAAVVLKEATK